MTGCFGRLEKVGVLVTQLGTPDAPTPQALRRYLRQFLSDPRVIELPRVLWYPILYGPILTFRPRRSARLYARVWTEGGSPLLVTTRSVAKRLNQQFPETLFEVGMRYGNPSISSALDRLIAAGCTRILLLPLYAQYAGATTGSTYDAVFAHLLEQRNVPTLRVVAPHYNDPRYLDAQFEIIREGLSRLPSKPDLLILSYHGVPKRYIRSGDVYCCQCTETTELLRPRIEALGVKIMQTFQSRFGPEAWLTPYLDETVEALPAQGVKKIAVACPGFSIDCLETIDEIGTEAAEAFHESGGEWLKLIPCLNDDPRWISALSGIVKDNLGDWMASGVACPVKCPAGVGPASSV